MVMLTKVLEPGHAWPHMIKGVKMFFALNNNFADGNPGSLKEGNTYVSIALQGGYNT